MRIAQIWRRIFFLIRRTRRDEEFAEEMRLHREPHAAKPRAPGIEANEAAHLARRGFGNPAVIREIAGDLWGLLRPAELWHDLRWGLRMPARSPGLAAAVVLTLGVGIGAVTGIFNLVNGVLLQALPFREPERLVALHEKIPGRMDRDIPFCPPDYLLLARQEEWFAKVGSYRNTAFEISGNGVPERVTGARVTASLFETLGVAPILGRTFTELEDDQGHKTALLSHAFWNRRFGQDTSVIGRGIQVDRLTYTIIGVLPPHFVFPLRGGQYNSAPADVFVPMSFTADQRQAYGTQYNNSVVARLKPGVTIEQVKAAASVLARRFEERYPTFIQKLPGFSLAVMVAPFHDEIVGRVRTLLLVMLAAVLMVLLIGCANAANLMLARGVVRARETAIRAALGASRWRLIRQTLAESSVLALAGGVLGVLVAALSTKALIAGSPIALPRSEALVMNYRVLFFAVAISALTALLFGLVPAIDGSRGEAADALREGGHGRTQGLHRRRWLRWFVAVQTALAVVLMIGAGLLIRSFTKLLEVDPGFRPQQVIGFSLNLPVQSYPQADQIRGFWEHLQERLSSIPGVESVGIGDLPLAVRTSRGVWPDDTSAIGSSPPLIRQSSVHGEYFRALGVPLLKGRRFTKQDVQGSEPVIILNETMARLFFPGKNALGRHLKWGGSAESRSPWMTVVGVVGDFKQSSLQETTEPMAFTPLMQEQDERIANPYDIARAQNLAVRTSGDSAAMASAVRRQIAELDPALPVTGLRTMEEAVREAAASQRFTTYLVGAFAALAISLALLGIVSIVAHSVGQRAREIGLRLALGASPQAVRLLMLREGLLYALIGIAVGASLALGLTRLMGALLFSVQATDPVTFGSVIGVVAIAAAAAGWLPAYRATRVDPMSVLRNE
jgi:putative ABC transport system permease protein